MNKRLFFVLISIALAGCAFNSKDLPPDYIEWRNDRTGIYNETGLLKTWDEDGPEMLWYFDGLGRGYTSVTAYGERLFVTGEIDDTGYLYVFGIDGKLQNKIEYGPEFTKSYPGTRNAVIPHEEKLYVVTGLMQLLCYDINTFNLLWKKDYAIDFEANTTYHGWHGPPLIIDEKLIIVPGGEKHNVVALNKTTGDIIWSSEGAGVMSGYGVPIYLDDQEVPQILVMTSDYIIGLESTTGKLLWSYAHTNRFREHPNTPVYSDNMALFMSGYGKGSVMLRFINGGRSVEKVWELPELEHRTGHILKFGDYVYGCGSSMDWFCVDWYTGKIMYSDRTIAVGSAIAAEGMLYCYSEKGEVALVKPNSQEFEIISKFIIRTGTGEHWAHPVIYRGTLYVRHGDSLMAYKIN